MRRVSRLCSAIAIGVSTGDAITTATTINTTAAWRMAE
jgi:hypothetical protein